MTVYGIVCGDSMTNKRIQSALRDQGAETVIVHSDSFFDSGEFQAFIVDYNSPYADLVIKNNPDKCYVFHQEGGEAIRAKVRKFGCQNVYGVGYFFSKILPKLKNV